MGWDADAESEPVAVAAADTAPLSPCALFAGNDSLFPIPHSRLYST